MPTMCDWGAGFLDGLDIHPPCCTIKSAGEPWLAFLLTFHNCISGLYHKNFLFFTRWHETTIWGEWEAKKSRRAVKQSSLSIFADFPAFQVVFAVRPDCGNGRPPHMVVSHLRRLAFVCPLSQQRHTSRQFVYLLFRPTDSNPIIIQFRF